MLPRGHEITGHETIPLLCICARRARAAAPNYNAHVVGRQDARGYDWQCCNLIGDPVFGTKNSLLADVFGPLIKTSVSLVRVCLSLRPSSHRSLRSSSQRSLSWITSLPPSLPSVNLARLYRPRIGRSVGVAPLSSLRPRVGRSVGVPPSRQSVCQGASVLASSSRRSLSWGTSLPSVSLVGRLCIVLALVAQFEYLPRL